MNRQDYYKCGVLATAAYVHMGGKSLDGATFAAEAADPTKAGGRLPVTLARRLFDPQFAVAGQPQWQVRSYYGADAPQYSQDKTGFGDKSGFAATLFERTENGQTEKVLALRGTETRTCLPPTRTPASTTWSGPARSPSSTT
jgi:hypothetical protein